MYRLLLEKKFLLLLDLAGGSSDAAATLKGLNELWDLKLTVDQLAEHGAKIGSDVSFVCMEEQLLQQVEEKKFKNYLLHQIVGLF